MATSMQSSPDPAITTASSQASTPSILAQFSMLDMELLHHWTTVTVQASIDFLTGIELYRTTVIRFAFEYPFVMHQLLALTAIHISYLRPNKQSTYRHAADSHAAMALSLFRTEIGNLTTENCHACFSFSTTIFMYAWASQELDKPSTLIFKPSSTYQSADIQWVKLHRGTNTILTTWWPVLENGPCHCLFVPWKDLDPNGPDPLLLDDEKHLTSLRGSWKDLPDQQRQILDTNLKITRRALSRVDFIPGSSRLAAGISWFSQISDEFIQMLAEKVPEALLIVCYYCVVLEKLSDTWWMKGKAENLLRTVLTELGEGWDTWTRWPMDRVLGETGVVPGLLYQT
ncbi:hypothetical protein EG329_003305 [Mollisiaceae sp. DMI_Dod_QoI]|nr:hypothetical protein EG329_003305 [Helotiales sp. DMI_Dod_QoI]